ncbi:MAG: hypothetical protein ABI113_20955 [Mucilaginibacter sp.]
MNMSVDEEGMDNATSQKDWWANLSEDQKQHFNEGLDDAENDRILSAAEFWNVLKMNEI